MLFHGEPLKSLRADPVCGRPGSTEVTSLMIDICVLCAQYGASKVSGSSVVMLFPLSLHMSFFARNTVNALHQDNPHAFCKSQCISTRFFPLYPPYRFSSPFCVPLSPCSLSLWSSHSVSLYLSRIRDSLCVLRRTLSVTKQALDNYFQVDGKGRKPVSDTRQVPTSFAAL